MLGQQRRHLLTRHSPFPDKSPTIGTRCLHRLAATTTIHPDGPTLALVMLGATGPLISVRRCRGGELGIPLCYKLSCSCCDNLICPASVDSWLVLGRGLGDAYLPRYIYGEDSRTIWRDRLLRVALHSGPRSAPWMVACSSLEWLMPVSA